MKNQQLIYKLNGSYISIKVPYIILLVFIFCQPTFAQRKYYKPGYVVQLNNDTIQGLVQDREEGVFEALYDRIRFVPSGKRWKKKYSAQDIKGYGYDGNVFEAIPFDEEMELFITRYYVNFKAPKVFLKLIQRNEVLTYYQKEFVDFDNNTIETFPLFYKNGSNQMVRVTQGLLGLKKKRLMEYFSYCPALVSAIQNMEVTQLQEVFDFYTEQCY